MDDMESRGDGSHPNTARTAAAIIAVAAVLAAAVMFVPGGGGIRVGDRVQYRQDYSGAPWEAVERLPTGGWRLRRDKGEVVADPTDIGPPPVPSGLAGRPEVATLTVPVDVRNPRRTVVHLADWPFVPADRFFAEQRSADPGVTAAELGDRYAAFLRGVEAVQAEQAATLRFLAEEHGLRTVLGAMPPEADGVQRSGAATTEGPFGLGNRSSDGSPFAPFDDARLADLAGGAAARLTADGLPFRVRSVEFAGLADGPATVVSEDDPLRPEDAVAAERAVAREAYAEDDPIVAVVLGGWYDLAKPLAAAGDVRLVRVEGPAYRDAVRTHRSGYRTASPIIVEEACGAYHA